MIVRYDDAANDRVKTGVGGLTCPCAVTAISLHWWRIIQTEGGRRTMGSESMAQVTIPFTGREGERDVVIGVGETTLLSSLRGSHPENRSQACENMK